MPDRPSKEQRAKALKVWQAEQRSAARAKLPLPNETMQQLFDMLNVQLPQQSCNHTLRIIQNWCTQQQLDFETISAWCRDNSSNCDCEVLANCEERWLDAIR